MSSDRIEALRQALEHSPDNYPLRIILAETMQKEGLPAEALAEYDQVLLAGQLPPEYLIRVGELALEVGNTEVASRCLDGALKAGVLDGVARLRSRLDEKLEEQGYVRVVMPTQKGGPEGFTKDSLLEEEQAITFADVGGLEDVKKTIHKTIILPLLRPDLYRKYKRRAGGGILLFGPPGCGKTMLARATAGECGLPFFNVRIEEVLDPYIGASERNLHMAFEQARLNRPCVLFLDELDALGYARRKHTSSSSRALVDQILQEMDAIGAENQEVLILAATNAPWDLDDALMRPGRFDRRIFVAPPDEKARQKIIQLMLADLPVEKVNEKALARQTTLFSGADLRVMVDHAVDLVIDEALETGSEPPVTGQHLETALVDLRPTTLDWLDRAQNYVEFANQDKRYDEVASFLRSREVRKWGKK